MGYYPFFRIHFCGLVTTQKGVGCSAGFGSFIIDDKAIHTDGKMADIITSFGVNIKK